MTCAYAGVERAASQADKTEEWAVSVLIDLGSSETQRAVCSEKQSNADTRADKVVWCVQMVLKCADIGHLAAPPRTPRRWAFQLEEEFFRQVTHPCSLIVHACVTRACVCVCVRACVCATPCTCTLPVREQCQVCLVAFRPERPVHLSICVKL